MGTVPWAAVLPPGAASAAGPIAVGPSAGAVLPWSLEMGVPSLLLGLKGLNSLCSPSIIEVALFFPKWYLEYKNPLKIFLPDQHQPFTSDKPHTNVRNCRM